MNTLTPNLTQAKHAALFFVERRSPAASGSIAPPNRRKEPPFGGALKQSGGRADQKTNGRGLEPQVSGSGVQPNYPFLLVLAEHPDPELDTGETRCTVFCGETLAGCERVNRPPPKGDVAGERPVAEPPQSGMSWALRRQTYVRRACRLPGLPPAERGPGGPPSPQEPWP